MAAKIGKARETARNYTETKEKQPEADSIKQHIQ
jgi:hypothetical protein